MDLLKRQLAPILDEAWAEIDGEAARVLQLDLAGRKLVDFNGPHGWGFAAVNTGRLELIDGAPEGVRAALRTVQPLVEYRVNFQLSVWDLDQLGRGGSNPKLDAVVEAARKAAVTEDSAIFNGFEAAGIRGIVSSSPHEPCKVSSDEDYPRAFLAATEVLRKAGIDGPYAAVLGPSVFDALYAARDDGYPIIKQVERILSGPIVRGSAVTGAVVMSTRGGDYELTVGQDFAVGYERHAGDSLTLYLTESFTFEVHDESAAVKISVGD
jgi:uncharacterized linocin/CFP29 family protein